MAITYAANETYEELVKEDFVIVDFYSATCAPCKMFSKILEDLEAEIPFLKIVKVNTTDYPELGEKNDVRAVPTILFFKDGEIVCRNVGIMTAEAVKEVMAQYM